MSHYLDLVIWHPEANTPAIIEVKSTSRNTDFAQMLTPDERAKIAEESKKCTITVVYALKRIGTGWEFHIVPCGAHNVYKSLLSRIGVVR